MTDMSKLTKRELVILSLLRAPAREAYEKQRDYAREYRAYQRWTR